MPREWPSFSENFRDSLATAFTLLSPSDLTQIVTHARRDVALGAGALEARMEHHLGDALSLLPPEARRRAKPRRNRQNKTGKPDKLGTTILAPPSNSTNPKN